MVFATDSSTAAASSLGVVLQPLKLVTRLLNLLLALSSLELLTTFQCASEASTSLMRSFLRL